MTLRQVSKPFPSKTEASLPGHGPTPCLGRTIDSNPRGDGAERAIRGGGVMEADTTFRSLRTRWITHRRRCLGPAIVVGLALELVAAACGAKVTPPTAASPIDSPPVVSPAQTPSFSPVVRTKVGTWLRLPRAPIPASVSASVW